MGSQFAEFQHGKYLPWAFLTQHINDMTITPQGLTHSMYVMTPTLHMSVGNETKS